MSNQATEDPLHFHYLKLCFTMLSHLICKVAFMIIANDILEYSNIFLFFWENKVYISCESTVLQMIYMKDQTLFFYGKKKKKQECFWMLTYVTCYYCN